MNIALESSLRSLVEKWLGPTSSTQVRVTRFGHAGSNQKHCVLIELLRAAGPVEFFSFRFHGGA
jgi:hypothetical protein